MNPTFQFKAKLWKWSGEKAAWHFISLPKDLSSTIKGFYDGPKRGFGSMRVEATIGKTSWKTSIFPDKKRASYLLPIKAVVRKAEGLKINDEIGLSITIL